MEAPTLERLRHAPGYDRPERSQAVTRHAYRVHSPFEAMWNRGSITEVQYRAAEKLNRHYHGAMGVNVSKGDGAPDPEAEYSQVYHGQQVANAAKLLLPFEFKGLVHLIEEVRDVETIGRDWLGCKQRGQAHIAGRALIIMALERLAVHWRLKEP